MHLNILSQDGVNASSEGKGYIANCMECNEEHVVCLYPNCYYACLASTAKKKRNNPWSYFLQQHYNTKHVNGIKSKRLMTPED